MYNKQNYSYDQGMYYNPQNYGYEPVNEVRDMEQEDYRPDDAEDAPTSPPPSQAPSLPSTFASPAQPGNMKSWMCNCLGRWGFYVYIVQGLSGEIYGSFRLK